MRSAFLMGLMLAQGPETPRKIDYADPNTWLCKPGRQDACAIDLTTTVVAADGTMTRETATIDPKAPTDCFYVYPTVSTDPGTTSDMTPDPAERNVIKQQFARFATTCRPFAPMYRQITLAGLRTRLSGRGGTAGATLGRGLAYDDVKAAWNYYLQHDNQGRGFVLVGHSQGAYILTELIRQEIDGKPIQSRLVSAMILGATVPVAKDKGGNGAFKSVALCQSSSQTGCLITYVSFRSTVPPPANTLFGRVDAAGAVAGCTNPAALGGGSGELHAYLDSRARTIASTPQGKPWVMPEQPIDSPFVSVPGLLTAKCATNEHATFLEITVHGNPADPRTDDITGDLGALTNWGLHLIDVNLAMGNLLDLVARQSKTYLSAKRK